LVSTVGLLSGVAIAGVPRETILLTGVVLIFVEAFSMAAGSFLSEVSAEEYSTQKDVAPGRSYGAGVTMFISYFVAGFIPLFPYLIAVENAFALSISFSVLALFVLGVGSGALSHTHIWRGALRMTVVGGVAIAVGVSVGSLLS
ncbi:MAG: VIT1/CCC1 transporter family protein, partial [Parcubacteria group bacterium]|nr:VIT1/CCC1 transporter family protein [Parcubacteria group bacterium]